MQLFHSCLKARVDTCSTIRFTTQYTKKHTSHKSNACIPQSSPKQFYNYHNYARGMQTVLYELEM